MNERMFCLCWLDECDCVFQRHQGPFTMCESKEIWDDCTKKPEPKKIHTLEIIELEEKDLREMFKKRKEVKKP